MAMNTAALAQNIKTVMQEIRTEENDPEASMNTFAIKLAEAIVNEVKNISITATAPNGPVTIVKVS